PERGDAIKWITYDSRDDLVAAMEKNELYGGLVIPEDFTRNLVSIAEPQVTGGTSQAATIEVLYNNGAGSLPSAQGKEIVNAAAQAVDARANGELLRRLQGQGTDVKPTMIPLVANPVHIVETDLIPAGENTGHGMGAFYIAVVTTVGAFLAADIVSVGVDFVAGHTSMGRFMSRLRGETVPATPLQMFIAKFSLFTLAAIISSGLLTWFVVSIMGTPVAGSLQFFGVILLGMMAIGMLTLFLITLLSLPGILIGLLFTTILGVPSAFGIFPKEMLPTVYQWLGEILPVRYLSDATRSLVFFDGRGGAGLTTGVQVLGAYAAISAVLAVVVAWIWTRWEVKEPIA
ncbi:MAG TPA: ABC transporter permease, partial [Thermomicrobiales bacterium]|nr:ABC transporter permease [Thermomicrobiales bacterium]